MKQLLVWVELDGVDLRTAGEVAHEVVDAIGPEASVTADVLAEDRKDGAVLVVGVADAAEVLEVARRVDRVVRSRGIEATHLAMLQAVQRVGGEHASLDDALLVVRLPVPEGREHEWNDWYRAPHMASLLETVGPAIRHGVRYAPLGGTTDYLVAYDFASAAAMRNWVDGQGIAAKRGGYRERWGVVNRMRALVRPGAERAE